MKELPELLHALKEQGIHDPRILEALASVPREAFIPEDSYESAFENRPLSIGYEQTISQPYIVALMSQALFANGPIDKVLEIGTGSGYQTAILSRLTRKVVSIERIRPLHRRAKLVLDQLEIDNVELIFDDGMNGYASGAPYGGIMITAACANIPMPLLKQLAHQGRLIAPVGTKHHQNLVVLDRYDDEFSQKIIEAVRFVPLLSGTNDLE